ncbi:condensin complex subunit 3-like isoform X2 [Babylonia areolata]|uniref:condensin complex subunit 3-like isoform X2 n=1 Tax=Babylonia areolata TaxID=304850 RepID=UPI003FD0CFAC
MTQALTIKDVLLQCQTSMQCHNKLVKVLKKIYMTMGVEEFWKELEQLIKFPMVVYNREPTVERTIDFLAKFVTALSPSPTQPTADSDAGPQHDQEDSNPVLQRLFDFLLQHHNANDRAVRFRACQLITKLLGNLGEEASIDDDLYEQVFHCMLERLRDKAAMVRVHAVLALVRLQDPTDDTCPVIKAYLFLMTSDPNPEVRKTIVSHIAPCRKTLVAILERTRDVKDTVRQAAFTVVADKIPMKALTISQRVQLLQQGLNDRTESVRRVCVSKMVQGWLRSSEGNVLDLLHGLDVENSTQVCRDMLQHLFSDAPIADLIANFSLLNDQCVIPADKLTCESAMYWRELCSYVHKAGTDYEQHLDMVLPACLNFCSYLNRVVGELVGCGDLDRQLELEFIIQHLLHLFSCMDLSDQACRKAVEKLLHQMLLSHHVGYSLVEHILPCLRSLHSSPHSLATYLAETVAEIRQPITIVETSVGAEERRKIDLQVAKVRVELNQAREEMEQSVQRQEFQRAAELKEAIARLEQERAALLDSSEPLLQEVRTEKNDAVTVVKCLTIICEMLESLPLQTLTPTLHMLMETQILPGMASQEASVRNLSVKAIGMCCQLKRDMVMLHLPVLMQASQVDVECVRVTAVKSLFDLIHVFGLGAFHDVDSDTTKNDDNDDDADRTVDSDSSRDLMQTTVQSEAAVTMEIEGGEHSESGWSKTASNLIAILTSALDSESGELRSVVAEGLAKLLMSGRVFSPALLSRLLLLWYNPLAEDDAQLRHTLGTFFPIFAFTNSANQELFEEAFLPTLRTIVNAPTTSPLNSVNPTNVADFLVELTHAQRLLSAQSNTAVVRDNPCHDSLAVKVCNEILSNPQSFQLRLWTRVLKQLCLSPDNLTHLKHLAVLCQQMLEVVKEKNSIKAVEKFHKTVNDLLAPLLAAELSAHSAPTPTRGGTQADTDTVKGTTDTPTMPPPAGPTTTAAKSTGRRARGKALDHSQLDSSVFTTPSQQEAMARSTVDGDVENVRTNLDSLLLDTSKTPRSSRSSGVKRALHTIQDPGLL